jgi:hypothetical protein
MALRSGNQTLATDYQQKLITTFPDADYTVAISDPNYAYNIRMMDVVQDSIYQQTYKSYLAEDTATVRQNYRIVNEKYPLADLLPKFMFLDALTYVQAGDPEGFKVALKALVEKYPSADVTELAGEMLKGVLRGRMMVQGGVKGMTWNLRFGLGEDGMLSAADSARVFTAEPNTTYRMLLMFPSGSVDRNQLLFAVAAYNFANFMVKEFDLNFEEVGPMSMLTMSGFYHLDEIVHYYKMIYGDEGYATSLDKNVVILPISDDNYETLMRGKTLEEYVAFFQSHFGEQLPELATRWEARMMAEEVKEEEAKAEVEETPVIEPVKEVIEEEVKEAPVIITAPVEQPKKLTLKDIEEIRKREAEVEEARKEEARKAFEAKQIADKELQERKEKENEGLLKQQKAEEETLLKAKVNREKQQELDRKAKQKQLEADRKAKLKAREDLRKQKEREYKERLKAKEKARKQKEREYKAKLKAKEKARKEALKAKEAAAKAKQKR